MIFVYFLIGLAALIALYFFVMIIVLPISMSPKGERLKKARNIILYILIFGIVGLALAYLEMNTDKIFPHKPTAKEKVMKRYSWAQDDMPEEYYQGILDAMDYDD